MNFADGSINAPTPCLVIDRKTLDFNIAEMSKRLPGDRLRPHVKAFKSTKIAQLLVDAGHKNFCVATCAEAIGLAKAGIGHDILLANQCLDVDLLAKVVALNENFTVAVDSLETIDAAFAAGVSRVLIDVCIGMPRCGCEPHDAKKLADRCVELGMTVRGVMGYEGHLMMVENRSERIDRVQNAVADLTQAAKDIGTDFISSGGTGTFDTNLAATEIQAGSFTLMDTDYDSLDLPFKPALWVEATVISKHSRGGWIVADAGLKAFGMDKGDPTWPHGDVFYCSDEHIVLVPKDIEAFKVGDRVRLCPAHVDPTVAKHEVFWVCNDPKPNALAEIWPIDLRHW